MTLVEFLRARLDKEEHDGRRLASVGGGVPVFIEGDGEPVVIQGARLLAEVDAKRWLVDRAEHVMTHSPNHAEVTAWLHVVQRLALPYVPHPDYQESWRPDAVSRLPE